MSGVTTATAVAYGVAAASAADAGFQAYESRKSGKRQEAAAERQMAQAERLNREEDQARNKANRKEADIGAALENNKIEGLGNTTLTGSMGAAIDPNKLGKGNNLLGQ